MPGFLFTQSALHVSAGIMIGVGLVLLLGKNRLNNRAKTVLMVAAIVLLIHLGVVLLMGGAQ